MMSAVTADLAPVRVHLDLTGAVQGVGFRPWVYRLAEQTGVSGWVLNDPHGVSLEIEGEPLAVQDFLRRLDREPPPLVRILSSNLQVLPPAGLTGFQIRLSEVDGPRTAHLLPDVATCPDCLADIHRIGDRRHAYPFTNCTNCGPRFSIILSLPYDRPNTTMSGFELCPTCRSEYENVSDRRFHAQPNACPVCGPKVSLFARHPITDLWTLQDTSEPLASTAAALRSGQIVALKGLGGFHLLADATNSATVERLRERKHREQKPFALMAPNLDHARALVELTPEEVALLLSPAAPIVIAKRLPNPPVVDSIAPGNPTLGVMLPCTPLHHLLLEMVDGPLVATSGNLSDEPICTDNDDAFDRLGRIADLFLVHNRPIARHVDDSVVTILDGAPRILRRARGYAPWPISLADDSPTILALGAHLKNSIALSVGANAFVSQHIGDLDTPGALHAFESVIRDFLNMYDAEPVAVALDLHPDYGSSRWLHRKLELADNLLPQGIQTIAVQHHHAHLAACLADNAHAGPVVAATWDGSGLGLDHTIWGGEFLLGDARSFRRVAHLRPFSLPGGDAAAREPRRSALALLWEMGLADQAMQLGLPFAPAEVDTLCRMLKQPHLAPRTTSAGRIFDGLSALLGRCQRNSFEGQAAMALEHAADRHERGHYSLSLLEPADATQSLVLDWEPLVLEILADLARGTTRPVIAARIQRGLAHAILEVALRVDSPTVALTGGCFQNRLLTESAAALLRAAGFQVLLHSQVPPNDGGISLGQLAVAAARLRLDPVTSHTG
jgi:hydrogenase maturation protein HypF